MTAETESTVTEQPATHKKKAQLWIFVLMGTLLLFLVISAIVQFNKGTTSNRKKKREPSVAQSTLPQDSQSAFDRQLKAIEARRQREADANERKNETAEQRLARLRANRDLNADTDPALADQRVVASGSRAVSTKSPEEQWQEKESLRALSSRASVLHVSLSDKGTQGAPALRGLSSPAASTGAQRRDRLTQEQSSVQAEIARVAALKAQVESGSLDQQQAAQLMSQGRLEQGGMSPISNIDNSVAGGESPAGSVAKRGAGAVVGKPASVSVRQPGQALISVGTVARAVLDQKVISDYAGPFRGMLVDDVYDVTSQHIMFPKGSRITGQTVRISNVNEPIQARMGLLIDWIVLPDGSKVSMNRATALDAQGVAAIKDSVNRHLVAQMLGVAAYALISSETSRAGSGGLNDNTFEGEMGDSLRTQFAPLARKYLDLVPTITLRPGTPLRIFFEDDIYAMPWTETSADVISQSRIARDR